MSVPAIAGPTTRAPLKIDELSANRVRQILRPDHLDEKRLSRRHVERAHEADAERERDQDRDGHGVPPHEHAEAECEQHEERLRDEEHRAPREPIRDGPRDRREEEDREVARERDLADVERTLLEAVDEPALGHALHPEADERRSLPHDEEAKVPVAQGREAGQHGAPL
jgi:hypothetical protein